MTWLGWLWEIAAGWLILSVLLALLVGRLLRRRHTVPVVYPQGSHVRIVP